MEKSKMKQINIEGIKLKGAIKKKLQFRTITPMVAGLIIVDRRDNTGNNIPIRAVYVWLRNRCPAGCHHLLIPAPLCDIPVPYFTDISCVLGKLAGIEVCNPDSGHILCINHCGGSDFHCCRT